MSVQAVVREVIPLFFFSFGIMAVVDALSGHCRCGSGGGGASAT